MIPAIIIGLALVAWLKFRKRAPNNPNDPHDIEYGHYWECE
jgi:hypothetical protein